MSTLLAVDLSNQIYKAVATHQVLSHNGVFTGGLYGFLAMLAKAINKTGATDILLCRDMRPYVRSLLYPAYKATRAKSRDEDIYQLFNESMGRVVDLALEMGWPMLGIDGFESDDIIAHCVRVDTFDDVVAMSNDSDLCQLLDMPFHIYKGAAMPLYGKKQFEEQWDMTTDQFRVALALMGTHNEVEGVGGIGPVNAKKILRNPAKLRRVYTMYGDIIARNLALIELPHRQFPAQVRIPTMKQRFDHRKLVRLVAKYDIDITGSMMQAFESLKRR